MQDRLLKVAKRDMTIITACSFAIFVLFFLIQTSAMDPYYLYNSLFIIPSLIVLLFAVLVFKQKINPTMARVISVVIIVLTMMAMFFAFVTNIFVQGMQSVEEPSRYERVLKVEGYPNELNEHFPEEIPSEASVKYFHYNPQFLQGGMVLELVMEVSDEQLEQYEQKFIEIKKRNEEADMIIEDEHVERYHGYDIRYGMAENCTIYILISDEVDGWNHGYVSKGVINKEEKIVAFNAELW